MNQKLDVALRLSKVTFRWASPGYEGSEKDEKQRQGDRTSITSTQVDDHEQKGFSLDNLDLTVPRGLLVALVGRVGSGKSSLLQGVSVICDVSPDTQIIGEMITSSGVVEIGGQLAYCQQTGRWRTNPTELTSSAWIQNTTLRENVLFGREWNEHRYWKSIQDASLLPDLEILPDGDLTEVSCSSPSQILTTRSAKKVSVFPQEFAERARKW